MGAFLVVSVQVVSVQLSAVCSQFPTEPGEHSHYFDRLSRDDCSAIGCAEYS